MRGARGAPDLRAKRARLRAVLRRLERLVVAFSGGKDSFFLAREALRVLGAENVYAVFVHTPFTGESALSRVAHLRRRLPLPLREIHLDLLRDRRLRRNPRDRCFLCKMRMFTALKREAAGLGVAAVADGTTVSDLAEHRPGRRALERLGIISPLRDAGFTSAEIAAALQRSGIPRRFLTSSTCLATRFPYDHPLDLRQVRAIGEVEHYLAGRGVQPLRVRFIPDGVRVETAERHYRRVLALKDDLLAFCRGRGLRFVTLDLGGMQSGPWDKPGAAGETMRTRPAPSGRAKKS